MEVSVGLESTMRVVRDNTTLSVLPKGVHLSDLIEPGDILNHA